MPTSLFLQDTHKQLWILQRHVSAPKRLSKSRHRLHQLRVSLKHWRALLRLLRAVDPTFPYPEVNAPFKPVFAKAGALRCWQIHAGVLEKTPGASEDFWDFYQEYIRRNMRKARKAFRKTLRKTELPNWDDLETEFRLSGKKCTKAALHAYFGTLREVIQHLVQVLEKRTSSNALHELRKNLKEYAINRRYAMQYWKLDPGAPPEIPKDHVNLDDLLGRWHDLAVSAAQLGNDLRNQDWPAAIVADGNQLLKVWKKEARRLLQAVVLLLESAKSTQTA
jgi:CHAD domain-containing protein